MPRVTIAPGVSATITDAGLERMPYGLTVRKGYDRARRSVWGGLVEGEAAGPARAGLGVAAFGAVGARADFEAVSIELRLRYGGLDYSLEAVELQQHQLGVDGAALRLFDLGSLSFGFGLRAGGEWIRQAFESAGQALDRDALAGRIGGLMRFEYAIQSAISARLSGGLDGYVLPGVDGPVLAAVPFAGMGVTLYVP